MYGYTYGLPQYYQNQTVPQFQQQTNGDERIWVQGENSAKSYLVANGATVTLWDSEKPRIYLKTVAGNGFPSMQILNYTVENTEQNAPLPTTSNGLEDRVKALETAIEDLKKAGVSNAD